MYMALMFSLTSYVCITCSTVGRSFFAGYKFRGCNFREFKFRETVSTALPRPLNWLNEAAIDAAKFNQR